MSNTTVVDKRNTVSLDNIKLKSTLLFCALLGAVIFYGIAFADNTLLHNAAHDVRHITHKPCHS